MNCLDDEADIVNPVRLEGSVQPKRGAGARPIRKRGFHRALARRELWAVCDDMLTKMARDLAMQYMYSAAERDDELRGLHFETMLK